MLAHVVVARVDPDFDRPRTAFVYHQSFWYDVWMLNRVGSGKRIFASVVLLVFIQNQGCSGSGSGGGNAATAGSFSAGGGSSGSGGSSLAGTNAGPPPTCSPATVLNPLTSQQCPGNCVCRTYAPDAGSLVLDTSRNSNMGIISLALPEPMKAGQPYSLSADITSVNYTGNIEFWGTTSECGPGLQKLFSAPVQTKTYCADVMPTQDFTHVLFVDALIWDGTSNSVEHTGNILACPAGRCPSTP
jgi:hypothetical protein